MSADAIVASTTSQSPQWQLEGFLGTPASLLLGWSHAAERVDAGVPEDVVTVISQALCRQARVSFLSSDLGGDLERLVAEHGKESYTLQTVREYEGIARLAARWFDKPARMAVVSSTDPHVVAYLFDDACFSWSLQGQMAFLSDPSSPAPDLRGVISKAWWRKYQAAPQEVIARYGLMGVLRPGVDGDVLGILFRSSADKDQFLAALQKEAKSSGMHLKMCDETEFMDSLAQQSQDVSQHEHPGA